MIMFLEQHGIHTSGMQAFKMQLSYNCILLDHSSNFYCVFSDIYAMCVAYPEPFADRLYQETKCFLDNHVKVLLEKVRANGEANLLKCYHQAWVEYSTGIGYLHCLYL